MGSSGSPWKLHEVLLVRLTNLLEGFVLAPVTVFFFVIVLLFYCFAYFLSLVLIREPALRLVPSPIVVVATHN